MSARAVGVSLVLGVLWHTMLALLAGGPIRVFSLGLLAGAAAGWCAGALTLWSRHRHHGRESILDGVLSYYVAVIVYALALIVIGFASGSNTAQRLGLLDLLLASWMMCWYAVWFASVLGFVLIPISFLTRRLLWRTAGSLPLDQAE